MAAPITVDMDTIMATPLTVDLDELPTTVTGASTVIDSSGSISVTVGATKLVAITCNQTITSLTLTFNTETRDKTLVATVADSAITKSGTTATLSITSAMTTADRTLRWSLVASSGEQVAGGLLFVSYDAEGT